jgi:hypothetical protein
MQLKQTTWRSRYQQSTHRMATNKNRGRFTENESGKPVSFDWLLRLIRCNESTGMERSMILHRKDG